MDPIHSEQEDAHRYGKTTFPLGKLVYAITEALLQAGDPPPELLPCSQLRPVSVFPHCPLVSFSLSILQVLLKQM